MIALKSKLPLKFRHHWVRQQTNHYLHYRLSVSGGLVEELCFLCFDRQHQMSTTAEIGLKLLLPLNLKE